MRSWYLDRRSGAPRPGGKLINKISQSSNPSGTESLSRLNKNGCMPSASKSANLGEEVVLPFIL